MPLQEFPGVNLSSSGLPEWVFVFAWEWVFAAVRASMSNGWPKLFPAAKVWSTFVVGEAPYSKLFLILANVFSNSSNRLHLAHPPRDRQIQVRNNGRKTDRTTGQLLIRVLLPLLGRQLIIRALFLLRCTPGTRSTCWISLTFDF